MKRITKNIGQKEDKNFQNRFVYYKKNKKIGVGVGTMILKRGKVLLGKRHSDSKKASSLLHGEGTWTMPGGKLHFGERIQDAAQREILEETGLLAKKLEIISISNDIVKDAHFVTIGFICSDFEGELKAMEPDEIIEWQWFDFKKLSDNIFFPSKKIIRNWLEKKLYID